MSWFGVNLNEGLSNIKGQISNFTKEVLTDEPRDSLNYKQSSEFTDGLDPSLYTRKDLESVVLRYKQTVDELKRHQATLEEQLRVSSFESNQKVSVLQQELRNTEKWKELQQRLADQEESHQAEISALKLRLEQSQGQNPQEDARNISSLKDQLEKAEDEKKYLSENLEELDSQHKVVVDQLLSKKNALTQDLSETKNLLIKVQNENSLYKDAIESKTTEFENLQTHCHGLESSEEEHHKLLDEITKLRNENQELIQESSEQQKSSISLEHLNEEKEINIKELQVKLNSLTQIVNELEEQNKHLKVSVEDNSSINKECESLANSNKDLQKENGTLKEEITKLSHEIGEQKKVVTTLNDTLTFKDEEILKHEAIFEEKCSEHSDMYDRLMGMRTNFEKREHEFKQETKDLEKKISVLENAHKNEASTGPSNDVVSKLLLSCNIQNLSDLPSAWTELESEVASLRCERDRLHESLNSIEQELRGSQDLLEALEIEKSDVERECEDLRDQLEELQCGERQPPEGSITPRSLPTIEEESELGPGSGIEEIILSDNEEPCKESLEIVPSNATLVSVHEDQNAFTGNFSDKVDETTILEDELNKHKALLIYKEDQIDQLKLGIEQIKEIFGLQQGDDLRQTYISIRQEFTSLLSKIDAKETEVNEMKKLNSDLEIANNVAKFEKEELERSALQQIAEKTSLLEANKGMLSKIQSENFGLNENLNLLLNERSNHADIEIKYNKVMSENSSKSEEIKSLLAAKEEIFQKFQKEVESRAEMTSNLEEMVNQHRKDIAKLEQQNAAALSKLQSTIEEKEKTISIRDIQLEDLRNQIEKLSTSCAGEEKLSLLLEASSKEKAAIEDKLKSCEDEKNAILTENSQLKSSLKLSKEELESLSNDLEKLKDEQRNTLVEISNLQTERTQMIATSTQKHQESIAYYAEIQRLSKLLEEEKLRWLQEDQRLKTRVAELQVELERTSKSTKDHEDVSKLQVKHLQEDLAKEKTSLQSLRDEHLKRNLEFQTLQKERDQLRKANSSFNQQYEEARKELTNIQEKEKTTLQECMRLREHLKTIEESTTQEALQSEQKEASLRQTIAKLHEKMASHSNIYSNANQKNAAQLESMQDELREVISERDEAKTHLAVAEESCLQYQESLSRLQQVLTDFQKTQGREIAQATEREKRRLEVEVQKNKSLHAEIEQLKDQMSDINSKISSSESLKAELQSKDDLVVALKSQVYSIQQAAKKTQERMLALQTSTDAKVDKPLLRNLFVGYFATPSDKRREVLHIIAQVLDFSPDERYRTGLDAQAGSWLSSIANFLAPPPSNIRITSKVDVLDHSSLSQAFIRFLEEETSPRLHPQLPAVEMARQTTSKVEKKLQVAKNIAKINERESKNSQSRMSPTTSSPLLDAQLALSLPTLHPMTSNSLTSSDSNSTFTSTSTTNNYVPQSLPTSTNTPHYLSSLLTATKENPDTSNSHS